MCCWFEIDPETGERVRDLDSTKSAQPGRLYLDDEWMDSLIDELGTFHDMLAAHTRPPKDDILKFVVDDVVPESFSQLDAAVVEETRQRLAEFWEDMSEAYEEAFDRDPLPAEKYWVAIGEVNKMATGRGQFYADKTVKSEEWLLHDMDLIRNKESWGRVRVFDDGSADAWYKNVLSGFDSEEAARCYIGEAEYVSLAILRSMPETAEKVPVTTPTNRSDEGVPFRYWQDW